MSAKNIEDKELRHYGSGCTDMTAYEAIKSTTKHAKSRDDEIHEAIKVVKNILRTFDLAAIERIKIKDKRTSKIYR